MYSSRLLTSHKRLTLYAYNIVRHQDKIGFVFKIRIRREFGYNTSIVIGRGLTKRDDRSVVSSQDGDKEVA